MLLELCDRRLIQLLKEINSGRAQGLITEEQKHVEAVVDAIFQASTRLAVYGTLAPGEENDWVLAPLQGCWSDGFVRGNLFLPGSWGDGIEYPGFEWKPEVHLVAVNSAGSKAGA